MKIKWGVGVISFFVAVLLLTAGRSVSAEPRVENLWTAPGSAQTQLSDGSIQTKLGHGIFRLNWIGGHAQLFGVTHHGKFVTYELEGKNELWHFSLNEMEESLRHNASGQDPMLSGNFDFTAAGLGFVHYAQVCPGIHNNEESILTFPDGRRIEIFSEHPLSLSQLENVGWVVASAPPNTFVSSHSPATFFVADELGEVRALGGKFFPLGGLHDSGAGKIFIRSHELKSFGSLAFILRHESGHGIDSRYGWLSKTLVGKDGALLFGRGSLALDDRGRINLKASSFESAYAATNANEDFAETHEFLLRIREAYNTKNLGQDLFRLAPAEFHEELTQQGISSDLQKKLAAILDHAYSDARMGADSRQPSFASLQASAASPNNLSR